MKKIKLFLAAMAAMIGMSASAQSWTASTVAGGEFYLLNVGTGEYFTKGNGWGTQASITTDGKASSALKVTLEDLDGIYKLVTNVGTSGYGVEYLSGGTIYTDQSRGKNSAWRFDQVGSNANGPIYGICSAGPHGGGEGKYMTASAENTIVGPADNANSAYAQWQLVKESETAAIYAAYIIKSSVEDYQTVRATIVAWTTSDAISNADEAKATFNTALEAADAKVEAATTIEEVNEAIADLKAAGNTFLESVTIGGGLDITNAWITNPAPGISGNTDGWTNSGSPSLQNQLFEYWNVSGGSTKQTLVNLPKGAYKLTAIAYTRDNMTATLYAGENTVNVVGCGSVNDRAGGSNWIAENETNGRTNLNFTLDEAAASLEIGLIADNATGDHWMCWRSFSLTYYGDPINLKKAELAAAVAAAQAIEEGTIPTAAYEAFAAVITANNKAWSTEDEYDAAVAAIEAAVAAAQPLVAPYAAYKVVAANAVIAGVEETTIDEQNAAVEEATTVAAIEACTATLQAAIDALAFDITTFTITSASPYADNNHNGWTATNGNRLSQWASNPVTYDAGNKCAEMWNNTGASMLYTITNLPAGSYRLTAIAGTRDNSGSVLKVGDKTIELASVGSLNSRSEVGNWFNEGNGVNELFFSLDNDAAELTIGLVAGTTGDAWTLWRSFKLDTFDESIAAGYLAPGYATLKQEAQTAHDDATYTNVTGDEKTALETAIAAEPSTVAEYEAAILALNTAVDAFKAAKTNYDLYVSELAIAQTISETITVEAPTTAAAALDAFKTLKVAEYNYVVEAYPYSATSKIGEFSTWERSGSVNGNTNVEFETLTSQHWSGTERTYYEQPAGGWSTNANTTWTANYTKTTTKLPAGEYIIKVAARAASSGGTTAYISCEGLTTSIPTLGDTGKGITTAGVASFDEGEFANNGNGRGWVWSYLPFTLTEDKEVTLTVVAEGNGDRQWFSVCDGELLSKTDIATVVNYDETVTNTVEDVDVAKVTMTRTIKEGFNTVVLPFDLTANQVQTAFGTGTEVYAFSENGEEKAEIITINFNKVVAGTISANVPVLVKATAASTEQVFNGVQVVAPTEGAIVPGTNASFVGVFGPTTIGEGHFFIGDGALYKSAGATNINAFRAYILLANPNTTSEVKLFVGDEEIVTGINSLTPALSEGEGAIYNVAGQRIQKMQKGINIVNGKKVMK